MNPVERKPNLYLRYGGALLFGALAALLMISARGIFEETDVVRIYRLLCDGFFLSAVLLIGVGLLTLVSGEGLFDIASYAIAATLHVMRIKKGGEKFISFIDYKKEKGSRRHGAMWYLVFVGLFYLAAALVFDMLFNAPVA